MGKIEQSVFQKNKRERTQKLILNAIVLAGVLPIALMAPNVLGAMAKLGLLNDKFHASKIKRSLDGLIKKGFVEFKSKENKKYLAITVKGQAILNRWKLRDYQIKKPRKWDGKWRMIIFDIQEKKRGSRDQLRQTLVQIGFEKLQQSVWVFPYDCEDLLMLIKADMELGKNLLYIVAEEIENDKKLRKHFHLI